MARSSKEYVIAPYGNTFAMYETMKLIAIQLKVLLIDKQVHII